MGGKKDLLGKEFRKHITKVKKVKRKQCRFQNWHQSSFYQLSAKKWWGQNRLYFNKKRQAGQAPSSNRKKNQYILPCTSQTMYMQWEGNYSQEKPSQRSL